MCIRDSLKVTNTGKRAGDEVVQLYIRDVLSSITTYEKNLAGFQRIHLEPGEAQELSFTIDRKHLELLDADMKWVVEPGDFVLMAGASSEDIRLNGTLTVEDYQTRAKAIEAQKPAKRVSASTNPEDAENVLDEKINTAWQGNKGDYITFALKNGTQVDKVTIAFTRDNNLPATFEIQLSGGGGQFLTVYSGTVSEYGAHKDLLQDLLLFYSSTQKKLVTLGEYVSRMPEEQKYIYYASGDSVEAVDHLPQTELLKDRSMEILYFTDKTDEFIPDIFRTYGDKAFRSAVDGDLELGDEKQPETADHQETLDFLKETLGSRVDQVKASGKLKSHPVCLTSGEGMTFEMEKYFAAVQPDLALKAKRILEVNVEHPAFAALESARITDPDRAKKYAEILLNQAMLIAGLPLENPSDYTDLVCSLWK